MNLADFPKTEQQRILSRNLSGAEAQIQKFIADTFESHYDAKVDTFCNTLLGVRDFAGNLSAAAGYNLAEEGHLFLEQYLNAPVEVVASKALGVNLSRFEIAEVGNLAAREAGGARMLIRMVTQHLHMIGRRYVVFTATRSLINSFHRLGLDPVELAPATKSRVSNPEKWGRYYDLEPRVVVGDIALGYRHMERLNLLTPMECLQ